VTQPARARATPPVAVVDVGGSDELQSIRAYRAIRAAIAELELRPGQPLSEAVLTRRFGFGRMPVREAVDRLRHDGLLEAVPRRGLFVKPLDLNEVREIYEMLEALDGMVVRLVAPAIGDTSLAQLRATASAEEQALQADDYPTWSRYNKAFHQQLVELAKNRRIASSMELLEEQVSRATRLAYPLRPKPFASVEEHRAIIEALARHDGEGARLVALRHRERVRNEIVGALEQVDGVLGAY
jgi:GntR family transcriptional regulator, rspAB operon transcriptional repressor